MATGMSFPYGTMTYSLRGCRHCRAGPILRGTTFARFGSLLGGRAIHRRSKDGAGTTPAPRPGCDCRAARRSLRQTAARKLLFERNENETIFFEGDFMRSPGRSRFQGSADRPGALTPLGSFLSPWL